MAEEIASFQLQGEGDMSISRSSTLVPQSCALATEGLSTIDEVGGDDCCVEEEQNRTSTAKEIASVQMEDVPFARAATLMLHTCQPVTEATPLLYKQCESNSTQEEIFDTSPLSAIMCGCQCS